MPLVVEAVNILFVALIDCKLILILEPNAIVVYIIDKVLGVEAVDILSVALVGCRLIMEPNAIVVLMIIEASVVDCVITDLIAIKAIQQKKINKNFMFS